ncbi:MAG: hypothetical protein EOP09_03765 [Proteobacteria bacterium]|nr:MAG: hypothetical protein EOP09_03765 [Pseudomonadota bacterium]
MNRFTLTRYLAHPSLWLITLGACLLLTLSSCGSKGITEKKTTTMAQSSTVTATPTPSETTAIGASAQPYDFSVYGASPKTVTPSLTTDNLLIVRIRAKAATKNQGIVQYTNFSAQYNCATFKVTMETQSGNSWVQTAEETTTSLNSDGTTGCNGGKTYHDIDFSQYLFPGHGQVRIKVQALQSDFYCNLYQKCINYVNSYRYWPSDCVWAAQANMSTYVCPLKDVYQYHTVNGRLDLQTNGTSL